MEKTIRNNPVNVTVFKRIKAVNMKTREEAESRALELYPIHPEFDVDRLKPIRDAYLQGWEEAQQDKQTCGFCVEPATELTDEKHSESLDTKEDEGSELPSEKH